MGANESRDNEAGAGAGDRELRGGEVVFDTGDDPAGGGVARSGVWRDSEDDFVLRCLREDEVATVFTLTIESSPLRKREYSLGPWRSSMAIFSDPNRSITC